MFRNLLPIAVVACGLMLSVVWGAFLGFEFLRVIESLL
jgi:hypothetical protein